MDPHVLVFARPSPPQLSERAARTKELLDRAGLDLLTVDVNRLCLSLAELGSEFPWEKETRLLDDIKEIREYQRRLRVYEDVRRRRRS